MSTKTKNFILAILVNTTKPDAIWNKKKKLKIRSDIKIFKKKEIIWRNITSLKIIVLIQPNFSIIIKIKKKPTINKIH